MRDCFKFCGLLRKPELYFNRKWDEDSTQGKYFFSQFGFQKFQQNTLSEKNFELLETFFFR